ncbi:hypothetical protein E2C01_088440 [Portunus trituberculatus]|uniref:Uncharacterized protein n=1 Tax=Portunus trituberculatus TaxID=210409 RepID=A0A5B7JGL4_PORTR|nr:hypothetical protein [Portunus trituberculatus]
MRRSSPYRLGVRSAGVRYDILGTFPFRHGGTLTSSCYTDTTPASMASC